LRLRFLGTGTSFGIPVIGCDCAVCTSTDPRDRRTRHGAVLENDAGTRRLLIDTPPELRVQLLRAGIRSIDAVWYTHSHADHTHGIDDLRAFSAHRRAPLVIHADPAAAAELRRRFEYIFDPGRIPPEGTSRPELRIATYDAYVDVELAGFRLTPLPVLHGDVPVFGFRCGPLGYITDAKTIPPRTLEHLVGVRVLVLNALWFGHRHPTHLNVEEAVQIARLIDAERTFLVHLTHRVRHADLAAALPPSIQPAYDDLVIEIGEEPEAQA